MEDKSLLLHLRFLIADFYSSSIIFRKGAIEYAININVLRNIIYIYFFDNNRHNKPHIHAKYQEFEVVISILDGEILSGSLPINKMKLLYAWMELHKEELLADWELAVNGQEPYKIEPLR